MNLVNIWKKTPTKVHLTIFSSLILMAIFSATFAFLQQPAKAATDRFYFAGTNSSYRLGESFTASVRVSASASRRQSIEANVVWDTSKLRADSVADSPYFPNMNVYGSRGGYYFVSENDYMSGDQLFGTIRFTVVGTGSASVSFTDESMIGDNGRPGKTNLNLTLLAAGCPAGQTGTPPNCTTPPPDVCPNIAGVQASVPAGMIKDGAGNCVSPPPAPSTPKPPTNPSTSPQPPSSDKKEDIPASKPAEVEVKIKEGSAISNMAVVPKVTTAKISFQTTTEFTSFTLKYRQSNSKQFIDLPVKIQPKNYSIELPNLLPKTKYDFVINGQDKDGKVSQADGKFTTRGFPVLLSFVSGDQKLANQTVKINGQDDSTDKDGRILLDEAAGTKLNMALSLADETFEQDYLVESRPIQKDGSVVEVQKYVFRITRYEAALSNLNLGLIIGGGIALLAVVAGLVVVIKKRMQRVKGASLPVDDGPDSSWNDLMQTVSSINEVPAAPVVLPEDQAVAVGPVASDIEEASPQPPAPIASPPPVAETGTVDPLTGEKIEDMFDEAKRTGRFDQL